MCDTIVALPNSTKNGRLLFGKNSDREPDEVQNLVIIPHEKHKRDEWVQCTYIKIPQVEETNRVLLSQPFWMWGAEMGINEHGVVIGNEALFTKLKKEAKTPALTGMDLLRLGLERGNTAAEARHIIIELLEKYGQGGNCGYRHKLYYMNGFIIADPKEAFVLETVGKNWAWKKVKDVWSISNIISIADDYDEISEDLIPFAKKRGWCKDAEDFNFRKAYSDTIITWGAAGAPREQCTRAQLESKKGNLTLEDIATILRTHTYNPRDGKRDEGWRIDKGMKGTVCKHAANSLTRPDNSVGSLITELRKPSEGENYDIVLSTGASNPCISPYFPVFMDEERSLPSMYRPGGEVFSGESFWWRAERIHRKVILNYPQAAPSIRKDIEEFEKNLFGSLSHNPLLKQEMDEHFESVNRLMEHWWDSVRSLPVGNISSGYKRFWAKYNAMNFPSGLE